MYDSRQVFKRGSEKRHNARKSCDLLGRDIQVTTSLPFGGFVVSEMLDSGSARNQ
jgi:hypothetical protein